MLWLLSYSSFLTSYSNEILVFLVALASSRSKMQPSSLRLPAYSFLKCMPLCNSTRITTFSPTTQSLRTFAKSSESFQGLTIFMLPFVIQASLPMAQILQPSPFKVTILTVMLFALALSPNQEQNFIFYQSKGYNWPTPTFAKPSVHSITEDPGLPLAAISSAVINAGPSAVCPFAYVLLMLFRRVAQASAMVSVSLKWAKEPIIDSLLLSLSPTKCKVQFLVSPKATTQLPKVTKPIFLKGSIFLISLICDSTADKIHCLRETKVLFWFCRPGKQFSCAQSPGYMNCRSIQISS